MAPRLLTALGLALALLLSGCAPPQEEPGLFRVRQPSPSVRQDASVPPPPQPPEATTGLPVAGEAVWTSGEGAQVTVRLAVHAVRRTSGATVLDFSLTPLAAPGLHDGDELPSGTDLGISREGDDGVRGWLLDPDSGHGYPPLAHTSRREFNHCLCSPLWSTEPELRLGTTRLLQVAFPALPARVGHVDVLLAGLPAFSHVPVTPTGQVPTVGRPVDLARGPEVVAPVNQPRVVGPLTGRDPRAYSVTIDRVLASPGSTSVEWTIRSITSGLDVRRKPLDPPLGPRVGPTVAVTTDRAVSGLLLRASGEAPALPARWLTTELFGRRAYECLCSNLGLWARSLDRAGGTVQGASLHPALPPGTRSAVVQWPGLPPVSVAVEVAPDAATAVGPPAARPARTWVYSSDVPPQGWPAADWPTPLPDPWQLVDYEAGEQDVTALPRG